MEDFGEKLILHYQPKIDVKAKKVVSAEALVRKIRDGKLIFPGEFIAQAERDGSIMDIENQVFKRVRQDAMYIFTKVQEPIEISFNVSAAHFEASDFVSKMDEIINLSKGFPISFEIEITETALIRDVPSALSKMKELKEKGFKFSLDDFGKGYASLTYLDIFPIDTIKIDKHFIDKMLENRKTRAIVAGIIYIADKLGIKSTAEGVEAFEQVEVLHKMGCSIIQGFYYSKPLFIDDFIEFVMAVNKPEKDKELSFIVWDEAKYSVGSYAIDTQHMIFVNLLNRFYRLLKTERVFSIDEFESLRRLTYEHLVYHTKVEENIMRRSEYPDIEDHLTHHYRVINALENLKITHGYSGKELLLNLTNVIKNWFMIHERKHDIKLMEYIKTKTGKILNNLIPINV